MEERRKPVGVLRFVVQAKPLQAALFGGILTFNALSACFNGPFAWAADLNNIRFKPMGSQTEVILDVNDKISDFTLNDDDPGRVSIQFSGKLASALKSGTTTPLKNHRNLKSVYLSQANGKVQLFIDRRGPSAVKSFMLDNPHRLVVRISENVEYTASSQVSPGVLHRKLVRHTARGPLNINILEVDLQHPEITIQPVMAANALHGKARVSQMVFKTPGGIAGVNASFFKPDSGTLLGTFIRDGELVAGPLYERVTLGITPNKQLKMARVKLHGKVTASDGQMLAIHNVNQPRVKANQYVLYTPRWGNYSPKSPENGVQMQIQDNRVTAVSDGPLPIPAKGYVLSGPAEGLARALQPDDMVDLQVYTTPDWSNVDQAVSGGPYLVKNGQVFVDVAAQAFKPGLFTKPAPRTALGFNRDNRLLLVTVDGRQDDSVGMTLTEMAHLMKELGATEAMNFDGGSSTQMIVQGKVVNSPSVRGGAPVSTALVVRHVDPAIIREVIGDNQRENSRSGRF